MTKEQAANCAAQAPPPGVLGNLDSLRKRQETLESQFAAELIAAIEAIDVNPLATTPRQHVEFTKRDAVDAVKRWIRG